MSTAQGASRTTCCVVELNQASAALIPASARIACALAISLLCNNLRSPMLDMRRAIAAPQDGTT